MQMVIGYSHIVLLVARLVSRKKKALHQFPMAEISVCFHSLLGVNTKYHITSKSMHGMNQTEAEHPRHGKRSQTASLSQIDPVVL